MCDFSLAMVQALQLGKSWREEELLTERVWLQDITWSGVCMRPGESDVLLLITTSQSWPSPISKIGKNVAPFKDGHHFRMDKITASYPSTVGGPICLEVNFRARGLWLVSTTETVVTYSSSAKECYGGEGRTSLCDSACEERDKTLRPAFLPTTRSGHRPLSIYQVEESADV